MINLNMTLEKAKKKLINPQKTFSNLYDKRSYPDFFLKSAHPSREFVNFIKEYFFDDIYTQNSPEEKSYFYKLTVDILFNSVERGNKCDPTLPISIDIWKAKNGRILRVEDCGEGFDIKQKLEQKSRKEKYFKRYGRGLRLFSDFDGDIFYNKVGNAFHLMYKHDPQK